jgi:hypothetical protein
MQPQVILANSLRDGAVTAQRLLATPTAVEAICCDVMLSECSEHSEGDGNAGIAVWYITASVCVAADAAINLSVSCADDMPASVGALAMHLALSKSFLAAVCSCSVGSPYSQQYIRAAATSALKVIATAASSALVTEPLDQSHPWAFGSDNLEIAVGCTGRNAKQLLLLAQEKLRFFG